MEVIIDASGIAVGRFGTFAAKQALLGKKVAIVNCKDAILTGKKHAIINTYRRKIIRGGFAQKGPYYPRVPEKFVKRSLRGMLPWEKTSGREAYKRIKCYSDVPKELEGKETIKFPKASPPFITVGELMERV